MNDRLMGSGWLIVDTGVKDGREDDGGDDGWLKLEKIWMSVGTVR
jgi:hypothetical protein